METSRRQVSLRRVVLLVNIYLWRITCSLLDNVSSIDRWACVSVANAVEPFRFPPSSIGESSGMTGTALDVFSSCCAAFDAGTRRIMGLQSIFRQELFEKIEIQYSRMKCIY